MFRVSSFHKLLDKATSNLRLEPDWPTVIQICDLIRQGDVNPKYALAAIKKKVTNPNPHVALFGLLVLESCVKNCGYLIHDEVGTKGYMEQLREIIRSNPHEDVKNKILELIQAWAHAFRNSSKYRAVQDTLNIMKTEGYKFPVLKESDAMFSADTAPEWADGDCCHRCRVAFGVVQRKHHCRACGQVFCAQCSSKTCMLPKYGIEKEVRVCDPCYDKHTKSTSSVKSEDFPTETVNSTAQPQKPNCQPGKSDEELREEEELQLALALSQSEAESAKKNIYRPVTRAQSFSPPVKLLSNDYEKEDPELARYLNRSFWENKSDMKENISQQTNKDNNLNLDTYHQHDPFTYEIEYDNFTEMLRSQVEIFVNRMKSNSSRGRPISTDSSIQTLFLNLTAMHSRLLHYIQEQDDQRVYYEMLQDKINQVKDARAALDALREEHKERLRREAEMAERQRQLQMAQKLEIMRQKKQEYLQYQRQLALKRVHDQEMELHMRQEQQKQQYRLGPYNSLPYIPSQQGGMSAFDPVTGMGMNSLPNGTNLPSNSYISPQHIPSATYGHYAQVPAPAPAPPQGPPNAIPTHHQSMQPQGMQPPPTVGQTHAPTTLYMPVAPHPSQEQMLPLGHMQPPQPPQSTTQSSQLPSQAQKIHGHPIYQMVPPQPSGATGGPPPPSLEQEYAGSQAQPILPPSQQQVGPNVMTNRQYQHSPLSSPSSSSEHSVIRQGPPPIPSAPSASSTPQPVEKEDVVELISFD